LSNKSWIGVFLFAIALFVTTVVIIQVDDNKFISKQQQQIDSLTALNDTLSMELFFFKKYIGEDSTWVAEKTNDPMSRK
jgi:hypothetical protein